MKNKSRNGNRKDGFVTISVRQEENGNGNDSEEKDEKQEESLARYDNGINQKVTKKNDDNKGKDKKDDFITI
jgi:hypothetical protein